jgi:hypothetical protein
MEDDGATFKPKISGDLLLVVETSRIFASISKARAIMNPKKMVLSLESASLVLTGYYGKKSQPAIRNKIHSLIPEVDKLLGGFETSGEKKGDSAIWRELYDIEMDLRNIWHDSGLQIGKGLDDGEDNSEFS